MAISAQRFSALDTETNVGISDYGSAAGSSVMNIGVNADKLSTASVDDLINSAVERNQIEEDGESALDKATRYTKGAMSSITDVSKLTGTAKADFLKSISGGNPTVSKSLGTMMDKCSTNRGLGSGLNRKPSGPTINCGNGNVSIGSGGSSSMGCSTYSYADLLNKLTGGLFSSIFKDSDSALRALMALAGYGYNLGMCGVFGSLLGSEAAAGLGKTELSQVSGGLLSGLGASGNVNGFLDVAKSSAGLTPLMCNPESVQNFYTNFNLGQSVPEGGMCTMSDRALAGGDLISDSWRLSDDGMSSISGVGTCNQSLCDVFGAKTADRSFAVDDLDSSNYLTDDDYWTAAYASGNSGSSADTSSLDSFW